MTAPVPRETVDAICLRGVAVHNLKTIDLDLPRNRLIAVCGVSGSGKTSLALDTLYAEGQRRYLESFSASTRQFLQQLDKPQAESIEGIPPSVAIVRRTAYRSSRATVGSAAQVNEYLQLLFARLGEVWCSDCGVKVEKQSADTAAEQLSAEFSGRRAMIGFASHRGAQRTSEAWIADLIALGYRRCLLGDAAAAIEPGLANRIDGQDELTVIVDRLVLQADAASRVRESLESVLEAGRGLATTWMEADDEGGAGLAREDLTVIDGRTWRRRLISRRLRCSSCGTLFPDVEPPLFNPNTPHGACPRCEGFGNIVDVDMQQVAPDPSKSLREGAIAPWNAPAYAHELQELLALAPEYGVPVDVPFSQLDERSLAILREGVPERQFGGLNGFFTWLERRKYKMHIRVFLSRWRSHRECPECHGSRLRKESLAVRVGGRNLAQVAATPLEESLAWLRGLTLTESQRLASRLAMEQTTSRLEYLTKIGLGRLSLERPLKTLSSGEAQRVTLTAALGSNLTGLLYVLDEPSAGLHQADLPSLVEALRHLRSRGNTVIAVEHQGAVIRAADHVIELGPGAGEFGGRIVFQGTPAAMIDCPESRTGDWLAGRAEDQSRRERRPPTHGSLRLVGARGHNLQNVAVEFPLGVLCLVTGVSGAGKSSLVERTLYPAVAKRLKLDADAPLPYDDLLGVGQIEDAQIVDQAPIGRTPRSNPVTYAKAFDGIRALFAESLDAQARGFKSGHFSFNAEGGRCEACQGDGSMKIDMKFLADVYMRCEECHGSRYRREVLEVKYRGLNIAEVLNLTVREAFNFFRGQRKILTRLQCLIDVGLDYLRLGQPANTLSGGESQRLKLANYVSAARRGRTLFVLDEPTAGLHFSDVMQLIECFDSLIAMGHSLIVVDHHPLMLQASDHVIDLGPGGGDAGGRVVAQGTPEAVAASPESVTGRYLADQLAQAAAVPAEKES